MKFRAGGDPSVVRVSPGQSTYDPITISSIKLENEGWERDQAVTEPTEEGFLDPATI